MDKQRKYINYKSFAIMTGLIFLILSVLWFGVYYLYTAPEITNYRQKIEASEKSVVAIQGDYLKGKIAGIANDLRYMSEMGLMVEFLNVEDTGFSYSLDRLGQEFVKLAEVNPMYDQIRIIDVDGLEIVRVNGGEDGGVLVPAEELQDKGDRYYFVETMAKEEGSVYQSRLDLNIENSKIEVPHKPMIRFGIKLFDDQGESNGILIINYNALEMLAFFEEFSKNSEGKSVLVDAEANYLAGHETENFAFMFDDYSGEGFSFFYESEWEKINSEYHDDETMQFYDDHGLHTAVEVALVEDAAYGARWYVISNVDLEYAPYSSNQSIMEVIIMGYLRAWYTLIPVLFISLVLSILLYQRWERLAEISELAQIDQMTKTFNRDAGLKMVTNQLEYAIKNVMDYSVCFIDLNDLKLVNDTHGHEVGDDYIMKSVEVIRSCFRDSDELIRMGGDEFLIGLHSSSAIVERNWRSVIEKVNKLNSEGIFPYKISLSHGVASAQEDELWHMEELIAQADRLMYEEKRMMKGL